MKEVLEKIGINPNDPYDERYERYKALEANIQQGRQQYDGILYHKPKS